MSTYAVYGMTWSYAWNKAKKDTSQVVGDIELTESEWLEKVRESAEGMMEGKKSVKVSDMFDAPQFAREFIELCDRGRDLHIRVRHKIKQPDGGWEMNEKTGKPNLKWSRLSELDGAK
jgi:hypothetical protein